MTHPAADDNNTDYSDDESDTASSDEESEDGVAGSNQVTRTVRAIPTREPNQSKMGRQQAPLEAK